MLTSYSSVDKAPVFLLFLNADQTVGYINDWGCRLLERTREEVIGAKWLDNYVVHENVAEIKRFFDMIMRGEVKLIETFENHIRTKSGRTHLISWNSKIVKDGKGNIIGMITIGDDVTDKKVLLQTLANQEMFNKKQLDDAVETAKLNQREEIASELHDNINQMLTTCKLLLDQELETNGKTPLVVKTHSILETVIKDIRNLSHRLNAMPVGYTDFELSLKEFIEGIAVASGLTFTITTTGSEKLNKAPTPVLSTIYRVVQEQISNIVKHANASQVQITIQVVEKTLQLKIEDNGQGFDMGKVTFGLGLNSMYNRVKLNKGNLRMEAAEGKGCVLFVEIPLYELPE